MDQRLSLVTLGVTDLARSVAFYEALGWRGQRVDGTAFFQLNGMALVLWGRDELAEDAGVDDAGRGFPAVALAVNVREQDEVDEVIGAMVAAGGRVTQPPRTTFYGGYAGYVADPDGHLWEVAHNPSFTLGPDGSLTLPDFDAAPPD